MFDIHIETGGGEARKVRCLHNECGIGRDQENLVVLQGWAIGRKHACLRALPDGMFLVPLEGRAAVRVNGRAINAAEGPIRKGDLIEIGEYRLRVSSESGEAAAARPQALRNASPANAGFHDGVAGPGRAGPAKPSPTPPAPAQDTAGGGGVETGGGDEIVEWRARVHVALVRQMDLRRVDVHKLSDEKLRRTTAELIEVVLDKEFQKLPRTIDRKLLARQVLDESIGLGPLETLIADDEVTEIMVNAADQIYIERAGQITRSPVYFTNDRAVLAAIERIVTPLGRRIDESSPMVDARLKDGSRVNAVIPPIALRGPSLSIRKFAKRALGGQDLLNYRSLDEGMLEFLETAVRERRNIVVTGGTGSGKTTLLNILSNFIPMTDRVVTIEDAAELKLVQPNLVALEARPANLEGKGQVSIRDLVKNALRMRPDRIVVGECRGGETLDMLQAMNTGHEGSLTTAHANSPRDAISRMEVMVLMAGMDLPMAVVREQICSAVDMIVHQRRYPCGSRKVSQITEVTGMESGTIQLQDIFTFDVQTQSGPDGKVKGRFRATGAIPEFMEELSKRGVQCDLSIFKPDGEAQ